MTDTQLQTKHVDKRADQRRAGDIADQFKTSSEAPRVGAYLRYSAGEDSKKLTIESQRADVLAYCQIKEWQVVEWYVDRAKSASGDTYRPEWERMRADVASGKLDFVVVKKLDRFVRNKLDYYESDKEFRQHGTQLVSIEESFDPTTIAGEAMRDITLTFAVMELKTIKERNRGMAAFRREHDMVPGIAPFGYRKTSKTKHSESTGRMIDEFVIEESEAKWLRAAAQRIIDGESLRSVARWLNDSDAPRPAKRSKTARARDEWTHLMLRQLLVRPTIAGLRNDPSNPSQWRIAPWTPILDESTWNTMLDALRDSKRRTHQPGAEGRTPKNLLSGILVCAHCGTPMRPRRQQNVADPERARRYQCVSSNLHPNACNGPSVIAVDAEEHVVRELLSFAASGRRLSPVVFREESEQAIIQKRIDDLEELYDIGRLSPAEYVRLRDMDQRKLDEIDERAKSDRRDSKITKLLGMGAKLADVWNEVDDNGDPVLDITIKRTIIREVFPLITCRKTGRGKIVPIADKITISDEPGVQS